MTNLLGYEGYLAAFAWSLKSLSQRGDLGEDACVHELIDTETIQWRVEIIKILFTPEEAAAICALPIRSYLDEFMKAQVKIGGPGQLS